VAPFDLTVRTLAVRATRRVHENSIPSINSTLPEFMTNILNARDSPKALTQHGMILPGIFAGIPCVHGE
jgi:hypothetical protein